MSEGRKSQDAATGIPGAWGENKQTMPEDRHEYIQRMNTLYLLINKKYLINFLSERFFAKKQMWLIFAPIQLLAVWATVSTPLFNTIIFARTGSVLGQADDSTDAQSEAEDDQTLMTALQLMRTLFDTMIGAILLIVTNLGKALQYERKAEQHKMVADEMKKVMSAIDVHLKTLPANGWDKQKSDEIFMDIEKAFDKSAEMSKSLSPPDKILMAFENLEDDMGFLMCKRVDEPPGAHTSMYVRKVKEGFYEVDDDTHYRMFKDGYSDLGDIISSNLSSILNFACMPSSRTMRAQTIKGLTETFYRLSDNVIEESQTFDRSSDDDAILFEESRAIHRLSNDDEVEKNLFEEKESISNDISSTSKNNDNVESV